MFYYFPHRYMGGFDLCDAFVGYYTVLRKTRKWYRSLFYHFVDIAVVNAFILHQLLAAAHNQRAKTPRKFHEALVMELADWRLQSEPAPPALPAPAPHMTGEPSGHACHRPMYISDKSDDSRRRCRVCSQNTLVFCQGCAVYLCFQGT